MGDVIPLHPAPIKQRQWLINGRTIFTKFVPDEGQLDAELLLIGEAPGKNENFNMNNRGEPFPRPFVGWSGQQLVRWWSDVDLYRRQFYITNVFPYWPPHKDGIEKLVTNDELDLWGDKLHEKIRKLRNLRMIVPTGNVALRALLGRRNIMNWRGSILQYTSRDGRKIKVIPTLHPAAVARDPSLERRCKLDWARISRDFDFPELQLPVRNHIIPLPDPKKYKIVIQNWVDKLVVAKSLGKVRFLTHDVETAGGRVTCVGFAWASDESITIPYDDVTYWSDPADLKWAFGIVKYLLEMDIPKLGQNCGYDVFWYYVYGINIKKWWWNLLAIHHTLDSSDSHSLEYMASVDTREPFWKKEGKEAGKLKDMTKLKDRDQYYRYNGKDCCTEHELGEKYIERLKNPEWLPDYIETLRRDELLNPQYIDQLEQEGLLGFYKRHYRDMFKPLMSLMLHGIPVDDKLRRKRLQMLQLEMLDIEDELEDIAGEALHSKKILSVKKLKKYLFETLKLPVYALTKSEQPSTNAVVLRQLLLKYNNKIAKMRYVINGPAAGKMRKGTKERRVAMIADWQLAAKTLDLILKFRKSYQTSTFYSAKRLDTDGRMRCTYSFNTVFGRLSSSKSPRGTGTNLQNQQRDIRDIFLPDKDCFLVEADLSQAESRSVGMYSRDPELMKLARSNPAEFDVHKYNASIIFGIPADDVDEERRDLGKRAVHASNYGMMGLRLSETLLKQPPHLVRTPDECQAMIDAYIAAQPGVVAYQEDTRFEVRRNRKLVTTWGRIFHFENYRPDEEMERDAFACRPQGEVADLLNQWGLIPAWQKIQKLKGFALNMQVHDSIVFSCPFAQLETAYELLKFIRASLERPRYYYNEPLIIPVEFKGGMNLLADPAQGGFKFKTFPDYKTFREKVLGAKETHQKLLREAA